jgi:hypothetical protein
MGSSPVAMAADRLPEECRFAAALGAVLHLDCRQIPERPAVK